MLRYEMLFLTVPELTSDEEKAIETGLDKLVRDAKGSITTFDRWGKYRLAYPVKKNDYGIYFLMRFEMENPGDLFEKIRYFFRVTHNAIVVRNGIFKLDPDSPTEYTRPDSLEDSPAQDVDKFIAENKMEGLMKQAEENKAASEAVEPVEEQPEDVSVDLSEKGQGEEESVEDNDDEVASA